MLRPCPAHKACARGSLGLCALGHRHASAACWQVAASSGLSGPRVRPAPRLQEGINRYVFGEGLNPLEQEWLAEVINEHLGEGAAPGMPLLAGPAA